MTKTEATTKALARYIANGGNEQKGRDLLAEIAAEPWCLVQSLVHWDLATPRTAPALAAALA